MRLIFSVPLIFKNNTLSFYLGLWSEPRGTLSLNVICWKLSVKTEGSYDIQLLLSIYGLNSHSWTLKDISLVNLRSQATARYVLVRSWEAQSWAIPTWANTRKLCYCNQGRTYLTNMCKAAGSNLAHHLGFFSKDQAFPYIEFWLPLCTRFENHSTKVLMMKLIVIWLMFGYALIMVHILKFVWM